MSAKNNQVHAVLSADSKLEEVKDQVQVGHHCREYPEVEFALSREHVSQFVGEVVVDEVA